MRAVTLGIETSGRSGRIALRADGEDLDERELSQAGRRHAQTLVLEIRDLLADCRFSPENISLAAVSEGPGSFTGLRVGVVCAKTLAWANGCGLAMVDTLRAIAAEAPSEVSRLQVVSDAQRGELFLGRYERTGSSSTIAAARRAAGTNPEPQDSWQRLGPIEIVTAESWATSLANETDDRFAVAGPGLLKAADLLPTGIRQLNRPRAEPAASTIARLGELSAAKGMLADPVTAEPFYIRKSAAEEKLEAAQRLPPAMQER